MAEVSATASRCRPSRRCVVREPRPSRGIPSPRQKGGYRHFLLKENPPSSRRRSSTRCAPILQEQSDVSLDGAREGRLGPAARRMILRRVRDGVARVASSASTSSRQIARSPRRLITRASPLARPVPRRGTVLVVISQSAGDRPTLSAARRKNRPAPGPCRLGAELLLSPWTTRSVYCLTAQA